MSHLQEALASVTRIVEKDGRDWSADRHDAFIYGVFYGAREGGDAVVRKAAQRHSWDQDFLDRLETLSVAVRKAAS